MKHDCGLACYGSLWKDPPTQDTACSMSRNPDIMPIGLDNCREFGMAARKLWELREEARPGRPWRLRLDLNSVLQAKCAF